MSITPHIQTFFLLDVSMETVPFFCFFSFFIVFSSIKLLLAFDTISPARLIHDGESLVSSSQMFELGFFCPGKSKNRYLGIWYKKSPEMVVWVANRNNPIIEPHGVLTICSNGSLLLLNKTKRVIWSSNISRRVENPMAQLLNTGNLVVWDNFSMNSSERYVWQSFDYPSDTLLPRMKLGWNLKAGLERYLTSWRSAEDPSPGDYTYRLDLDILPQISLYRRSVKMGRVGPWNGVYFRYIRSNPYMSYEPIFVDNQDEIYYMYESYNNPIIMLLKLNHSGNMQRLIWSERSSQWNVVFSVPADNPCEYYENCGANTVCSINKTPNCECLKGSKPKSQHNWTWPRTCVTSDCKSGDRFMKLSSINLPDLLKVSLNESMDLRECESECLKNCSCRAYANSNVTGGGSGCLMWFGDLIDIQRITNGMDIYVRIPASESGNKKLLWVVVIVVAPTVLLPAFYILCYRKRKHKKKGESEKSKDLLLFDTSMSMRTSNIELCDGDSTGKGKSKDAWLPFFSFASVSAATSNFSPENKLGEGGFGPVYKGKLLNGQEVAVKRLSRHSGQGLDELKNETMLIAKLQHRNLVRVLGCCIENGEKILIYEHMPNKSLDSFLFDPTKKSLLSWATRVRIIEGIAQGLLYLHQYSRLRIIHRDLKVSNILLDNDMNPKISDFGLARMFAGDETQANTRRIVGTFGYISPEYALQGLFSIKSDVYSFGVLLLETVSSQKNTSFHHNGSHNLLGYAWKLWREDKALDLMDPVLENKASYLILVRYINVALLCVQENAADRPNMSEVVSMLTNELLVLPSPKQPPSCYLKSSQNSIPPLRTVGACSMNDITITEMEAR